MNVHERKVAVPDALIEDFNAQWSPEIGAIDGRDLSFIYDLMREARPKRVVEIGCCTGLSTAMMARIMDELDGGEILSYDLNDKLYFDRSKDVGHLVKELAADTRTHIEITTGRTALYAGETLVDAPADFAFIDASHQHPWPLFDTFCLLPSLAPNSYVVHHDLQFFKDPQVGYSNGPKTLFDQIPDELRVLPSKRFGGAFDQRLKSRELSDNIYAFQRPEDIGELARKLAEGFCLPWYLTPNHAPNDQWLNRVEAFLAQHYERPVLTLFQRGRARYAKNHLKVWPGAGAKKN